MDLEQLEKLHELKEKGILTQEEFEEKKKELLNGPVISSKTEAPANGNADFSHLGVIKGSFNAFISAFKRWKDVKGRTSRFDYWGATIVSLLITLIIEGIALINETAGGLLSRIYGLIMLVVGIRLVIRRLHDVNRSAWWILFPIALFFKGDKDANRFGPAFATDEKKAIKTLILNLVMPFVTFALALSFAAVRYIADLSDDSETVETKKTIP